MRLSMAYDAVNSARCGTRETVSLRPVPAPLPPAKRRRRMKESPV